MSFPSRCVEFEFWTLWSHPETSVIHPYSPLLLLLHQEVEAHVWTFNINQHKFLKSIKLKIELYCRRDSTHLIISTLRRSNSPKVLGLCECTLIYFFVCSTEKNIAGSCISSIEKPRSIICKLADDLSWGPSQHPRYSSPVSKKVK